MRACLICELWATVIGVVMAVGGLHPAAASCSHVLAAGLHPAIPRLARAVVQSAPSCHSTADIC